MYYTNKCQHCRGSSYVFMSGVWKSLGNYDLILRSCWLHFEGVCVLIAVALIPHMLVISSKCLPIPIWECLRHLSFCSISTATSICVSHVSATQLFCFYFQSPSYLFQPFLCDPIELLRPSMLLHQSLLGFGVWSQSLDQIVLCV